MSELIFNFTVADRKRILGETSSSYPRKNLWIICAVVNAHWSGGRTKINSATAEDGVIKMHLDNRWKRDPKAKDQIGLRKTIGDLLGGHGLKLERLGRRKGGIVFAIPKDGITDEYLISVGIDPQEVEQQSLNPAIIEAVKSHKTFLFHYDDDPTGAITRVFEPYIYYRSKTMPMVAGVQTSGYSSSEEIARAKGKTLGNPKWRIFQADKIYSLEPGKCAFTPDAAFNPNATRPGKDGEDTALYPTIYATV